MEFVTENINLVLFLPLIVCLIIGFNGLVSNRIENNTLFSISISSSVACGIFSVFILVFALLQGKSITYNYNWLSFENIKFYFGVLVDKISVVFLLLVAVFNIFTQALAFFKMRNQYEFPRLLFYLNLFVLGLNGIFLSSNIFQTYLFCEIVGVASFLLISFDFFSREQSRAGIKSFIYNRVGDLALLFCVLVVMYYAVIYNELSYQNALAYSSLYTVSICINSLMSTPLFVFFCALLIFVIIMKFVQAFSCISSECVADTSLGVIVATQNLLLAFVGVYLFLRFEPFFTLLNDNWWWCVPVVLLIFLAFFVLSKLFIPMCRIFLWIEKYVIETITNFSMLGFRFLSYVCDVMHGKSFGGYIIYSLIGLILILFFVYIFYEKFMTI